MRADVRRDLSLPAFREIAAWNELKAKQGAGGIIPINWGCRWSTGDVVDEADRYELTISWSGKKDVATDITLRRRQKFKPEKGRLCAWELRAAPGKDAKIL